MCNIFSKKHPAAFLDTAYYSPRCELPRCKRVPLIFIGILSLGDLQQRELVTKSPRCKLGLSDNFLEMLQL